MTGLPVRKYEQAAAIVRAQITDGTLKPGQPAPSGDALARLTGFSTLTCRKALRTLIRDGVLTPGLEPGRPSPRRRPRRAAPRGRGPPAVPRAGRSCAAPAD